MTEHILDLSDRPVRLSVRHDLLVMDFSERQPRRSAISPLGDPGVARDPLSGLRRRNDDHATLPLAEVAVLVVAHPEVSFTHAVLSGLAHAGGMFIACDEKRMPCAMLLPLATHSTQTERFRVQADVSAPTKKRLWQGIVKNKILAQARLLRERTERDWGLEMLAGTVRSGDPENLEARAARIYWGQLFKEEQDFRRDPDGEGLNPLLNYGYAVLRAIAARAVCAAGLHPSLGIHHHNRYDAFCLADDLMEPFRPIVDRVVVRLNDKRGPNPPLDAESKRLLLEPLLSRFTHQGESRTLFEWLNRAASSLASAFAGGERKVQIPLL